MLITTTFWISVLLIVFTYFLFPVILAARARFDKKKRIHAPDNDTNASFPEISILIAAHNEAGCIIEKLNNVFSLTYPESRLEVIVASDGSTDGTNELVSSFPNPKVRLLVLPRQGKNATLNAAASVAKGEILVFTDADAVMQQDALMHLVRPFQDPYVGAVGGDYRYVSHERNSNEETTYWKYDRVLKRNQSKAGSMTSATGQIYAIRKFMFRPIPPKLVDDFFTSVQAVSSGYRLVYEPRAVAFGPAAPPGKQEFHRKVRVITGGLRTVWRLRHLLNPFRFGFYSFQLFAHKVLRRVLVIPFLLTGICAVLLRDHHWIYQLTFSAHIALHSLAFTGFLLKDTRLGRIKVFSLPFFFDLVNLACLTAFANLARGVRHDIWQTAGRGMTATASN